MCERDCMTRVSKARTEENFNSEFVATATKAIVAIEAWADDVVSAWLDRRDGTFSWRHPDFWLDLEVSVEGRSITSGEALVTRHRDGFFALVNGKRYRCRHRKMEIECIQGALTRRDVPGVAVPPPLRWDFVSAEDLDRWYDAAKVWQALEPHARMERYIGIAEQMAGALLSDDTREHYSDGYYLAYADATCIYTGAECIATRPTMEPRPVLLSSRRYRVGSFAWGLREGLRIVFGTYNIPVREVRPIGKGYSWPSQLWQAWYDSQPHLVDN